MFQVGPYLMGFTIGPPVQLEIGPVLTLDDAVGLKMRALHDRPAHRDFIDLERVAAVHTPHFASADHVDRLEAAERAPQPSFGEGRPEPDWDAYLED